jgi:hypothetical protein
MNYDSHHILTRLVCERLNFSSSEVDIAVKYSSFPDYASDIIFNIGSYETDSVLNHDGGALAHFCRPTRDMKYMGYLFNKDGSITKFKKPEIISISVRANKWNEFLIRGCEQEHPVQKLLDINGYTKDIFKFTFPTSAVMADFIFKNTMWTDSNWIKAASCCAHLGADSCVRDHVWATLFGGHQTYEGKIDELVKSRGEEIVDKIWKNLKLNVREPRKIIEMQAEKTGAFSGRPSPRWAIENAVETMANIFYFFIGSSRSFFRG